jgi:hypothetical protein
VRKKALGGDRLIPDKLNVNGFYRRAFLGLNGSRRSKQQPGSQCRKSAFEKTGSVKSR